VEFLGVYVREAHPTDGWRMSSNDKAGVAFAQPTTKAEREAIAAKCCQSLLMTMPLLVDDLDDRVGHLYSGMPDRIYVIGRDGRVVYKGGRGPFGFLPGEMEQALVMHLLEDVPAPPRQQGRLPVLNDAETWKHLPPTEEGGGQPLPIWARATAHSLPRTTAAMLELDYRQRAGSPLDPKLRAKMRWVAATVNKSPYGTAYAFADLKRAGATDDELNALTGSSPWPEAEREALGFARKMTLAASTVTDAEVKRLRERHGDAHVVAMVQLLAYANFQDRLLLSLDLPVEPNGPLAPLAVRFAKGAPAPAVPPRRRPTTSFAASEGKTAIDPDWAKLDFDYLQKQMEGQRGREPRIPVPAWEEVKKRMPPDAPLPAGPLRIRWSRVCNGYQPELAYAWTKCTRAFGEESAQDRVFEESLFWVVTRSLECFY
jgi:alkylhydroperoxidase family enzyme